MEICLNCPLEPRTPRSAQNKKVSGGMLGGEWRVNQQTTMGKAWLCHAGVHSSSWQSDAGSKSNEATDDAIDGQVVAVHDQECSTLKCVKGASELWWERVGKGVSGKVDWLCFSTIKPERVVIPPNHWGFSGSFLTKTFHRIWFWQRLCCIQASDLAHNTRVKADGGHGQAHGSIQIRDEVANVLDAARNAHQVVGQAPFRSHCRLQALMYTKTLCIELCASPCISCYAFIQ
eukprot:scaffold207304_cov15-Tisochrysis_lutea.AAC.1